MRVTTGDMIRIRDALEVVLMAGIAIKGETIILPTCMTRCASETDVRAGQWEVGAIVIEVPAFPITGGMALEAIMREPGGLMVGIICIQIILFMTGPAVRSEVIEIAIGVALGAIHGHVGTRQRETGIVVIESGGFPR